MSQLQLTDVPSGTVATVPTPAPGDPRLARLSLNQRTIPRWSVPELVEGCARTGVPAVGLWREPVAEHGLDATAKLVRDAGLRVSSLCRGGFLTAVDRGERARAIEDNRRAIDEAATLGTSELAMVVGGLPEGSRDLRGARQRVADAVAELAPYARERGVRLALEPLHPMFCADRSVLSTLDEALALAADVESGNVDAVGVVVDAYHVWWDPALPGALGRAASRIAAFQVCDWVVPLAADVLLARGMMGDGLVDLHALRAAVDATGYRGDIEVEIFNVDLWAAEPHHALETVLRRYVEHVVPPSEAP